MPFVTISHTGRVPNGARNLRASARKEPQMPNKPEDVKKLKERAADAADREAAEETVQDAAGDESQ